MNERGAIIHAIISAKKPSEGKAYADAFSVRRHVGYLENHLPQFSVDNCLIKTIIFNVFVARAWQ